MYTRFHAGNIVTIVQPLYGDVNVCVGKEWYRFPSSFYLPSEKWKLRFLRSEFKGQLPKEYSDGRNGTWAIPEHMNDMNREEPSRYVGWMERNVHVHTLTHTHSLMSLSVTFLLIWTYLMAQNWSLAMFKIVIRGNW